jgi:hypothetical protein
MNVSVLDPHQQKHLSSDIQYLVEKENPITRRWMIDRRFHGIKVNKCFMDAISKNL